MRRWLWFLLTALAVVACRDDDPVAPSRAEPRPARAEPHAPATEPAPAYDLATQLEACEIRHRGLSIDVGNPSADLRRTYRVGPFSDVASVDRAGGSFGRILTRVLSYEFWLDQPESDLTFSLRILGASAGNVSAELDGKRIGSAKLTRGEAKLVTLPTIGGETAAGRRVLTLRFSGKAPPKGEPFAEIDWIRIGVPDDIQATYAAPTLNDVRRDVVLDGKPRRSIVLRAPSSVRCPLEPVRGAELDLLLGFWGEGSGEAEIRLLRDGEPPVVLDRHKLTGGTGATWTPVRIGLGEYAGQVVALEFAALDTTRGGRVVFGEPTLTRKPAAAARVPEAKTVVVLVASGLDRRRVPPAGPIGGLSALGELVRASAAFASYRVPTTLAAGVVASLLTGLPPRAHTLEDQAARLPASVRTISEMLKEAGGRAAMFSSVPATFRAFGFDAGWDEFDEVSPVKDLPGHEAITRASHWLEQELNGPQPGVRRLVVVHTRGAHPPWDLSREEVALLKPEDYSGALDARRASIVLAGIRTRRNKAERRLSDQDWRRLHQLMDAAMLKQSAAMGQLFAMLKRTKAWDDTLLVFMGDTSVGEPPDVPFDPAPALAEDHLLVPLIVKFPHAALAGQEVPTLATTVDVTATILRALSVKLPEGVAGLDLHELANGQAPVAGRAASATLGATFATRLGRYLYRGTFGAEPQLCQLDIDPSCATNVLGDRPLAARLAWRHTYAAESAARIARRADREPASIDPDTAAALTVWGDIQ